MKFKLLTSLTIATGVIVCSVMFALQSCTDAQMKQFTQSANTVLNANSPLTNGEAISGLREALNVGIKNASGFASATDGFFKNAAIKLLFPPEAQNIETKLRSLGFGNLCDQFIESLNRGAEKASASSVDVFKNAIMGMSIADGFNILKGNNTAATEYLKSKTTAQLTSNFKPIIQTSLDQVNATKYWADIVGTYNKIPFITKMNPDLAGYATDKAIGGLFQLVATEEQKIRENPAARVNDVLKRVFDKNNWPK